MNFSLANSLPGQRPLEPIALEARFQRQTKRGTFATDDNTMSAINRQSTIEPDEIGDGTLVAKRGIVSNQTNSPGMTPDLNRIGSIVTSWQRHVVTAEEAQQAIMKALEPGRFMPKSELIPDSDPATTSHHVAAAMARVERKLNLLIRHHDLLLPDDLDPDILSDEAKKLADQNRKIEAVSLHRARTGSNLPQAVELINRYLRQQRGTD